MILDKLNDFDCLSGVNSIKNLDTPYYDTSKMNDILRELKPGSFSILHVNIRSMNKNFDTFTHMLTKIDFHFKIICLSETMV